MSTTDTEYRDCAVCENKTQLRCDACREVYFCSRECQRMIWSTHNWTCGKLSLPFTFPPLTSLEVADLERRKDETYVRDSAGDHSLLEWMNRRGVFPGAWDELVVFLSTPSPPWLSYIDPLFRAFAHDFLHLHRKQDPSSLTPWRLIAPTFLQLIAKGGELGRTYEQVTPFLHQLLIFLAIIDQSNQKPTERAIQLQVQACRVSIGRVTDVIATLDIDEGFRQHISMHWDGKAEAIVEKLRGTDHEEGER